MMTVHPLRAGDGYTYLTSQVASDDQQRAVGQSLGDYYLESGNPPGQWLGTGIGSLSVSGQVSEQQMKALYGEGLHPDADRIIEQAIAHGSTAEEALKSAQLGRAMAHYSPVDDGFDQRLRDTVGAFHTDFGRSPERAELDAIRFGAARYHLAGEAGPAGVDDVTVRRFLAGRGSQNRAPVSGFDLVFTPVKSASVLWGLGDDAVMHVVQQAHDDAVASALGELEKDAAFTRRGAGGIEQIETHGLVAAKFDHRDSRAGDPNLHSHVVVANRVEGVDGVWRTLDSRTLHTFAVSASEHYNVEMERLLSQRLGVSFEDVHTRRGVRAVREIVGIPAELRTEFAARSVDIEASLEGLIEEYKRAHGVAPSKATQVRLAQEATLATRPAKETGVTLRERRTQWQERARQVLGGDRQPSAVISSILGTATTNRATLTDNEISAIAERVVDVLSDERSRWRLSHIKAETERQLRAYLSPGAHGHADLVDAVVHSGGQPSGLTLSHVIDIDQVRSKVASLAYDNYSVSLEAPEMLALPSVLTRSDGASVFRVHGAPFRTSTRVLAREDALLEAAHLDAGPVFDPGNATLISSLGQRPLDNGQLAVATEFLSSGKLVHAAVGPAGAGKTTAMRVFARAVELGGGKVVALAPSASAAGVLSDELEVEADTVAKFISVHSGTGKSRRQMHLDPSTIVLIDEAGMADIADLNSVIDVAHRHGASVRLIGDPAQLDAVTGAGALRLLDKRVGAARLTEIHRFCNPLETAATLGVREGQISAADFYIDSGKLTAGTRGDVLERIFDAWHEDATAGRVSLMIAATGADVAALSERAQAARVAAGDVSMTDISLHTGSRLGVGDVIVTRRNDRHNRVGNGFVRNGDTWTVNAVDERAQVHAVNAAGESAVLNAAYVRDNVELGYATTIHRAQGATVDTAHALVNDSTTREQLYVALTRGRESNQVYAITEPLMDVDGHTPIPDVAAAAAILRTAIGREGSEMSATETFENELAAADNLEHMLARYEHVIDTHSADVDTIAIRSLVIEGLGADAYRVAADPHFDALVDHVGRLAAADVDVRARLTTLDRSLLGSTRSPARFVSTVLGPIGPGTRTGDPALNAWLQGMERQIRDRLADAIPAQVARHDLDQLRTAWGVIATTEPTTSSAPSLTVDADRAQRIQDHLDRLRNGGRGKGVSKTSARPETPTKDFDGPVQGF